MQQVRVLSDPNTTCALGLVSPAELLLITAGRNMDEREDTLLNDWQYRDVKGQDICHQPRACTSVLLV